MADCMQVPLLLFICIFSHLPQIEGEIIINAVAAPVGTADTPQGFTGGPGETSPDPRRTPGASLNRIHTPGWKLAEEAVCREDLTRLFPNHTWRNNLAVLERLEDRKSSAISAECNHLLWNYKIDLTTAPEFEALAVEVCNSTISEIEECAAEELGKGYLVSCLVDHRFDISDYQCSQFITKMTAIVFSDYRLIRGFMDKCRDDINKRRCGRFGIREEDFHTQGEVIACLQRAVVQEVEGQPGAQPFNQECKEAVMKAAELSSDDFHLDRHLYFACREDRERFCDNTLAGGGRVYKCLFNHKFEEAMSERCREALTTRQKLIAQDYRVSYSLARACQSDLRRHQCSADSNVPRGREASLSHLLLCLQSAVDRGLGVSGECQAEMMDHRRMLIEDFSLSPEVMLHCRREIEAHCSGLQREGRSLHCLMRVDCRDVGHVDPGCQSALSRGCRVEVQRILHQRALDTWLNPELQVSCAIDLGKWCSETLEPGRELECMQDHLEDLEPNCRDVVGNLTEMESMDIRNNVLLMRDCEPAIQTHCYEVAESQDDTGDLLECLIRNKNQREMSERCATGLTRFQLLQSKDLRFSYKFKTACKEDILRLCPNIMKKVDAVTCLSTAVRNATLQDATPRVSIRCRRQLREEEVQMTEDIRLQPELFNSCRQDIYKLCQNVAFGNAQVTECLRDNKHLLTVSCHQQIFRLQQVEMMDPELDYQLMRVCRHMIRRFCSEVDGRNIFACLKQSKNSELMDPKCKQLITKRQITQYTDYRLNPILRRACKADIPKFCQPILSHASTDSDLEGQVIACLKLRYADQRLSQDCEDQIRVVLQESAIDYRLDPQLQIHCRDEISRLCEEEAEVLEQSGQVGECLKTNLLKIRQDTCRQEVINMLKVSKADIFVDPVLHTACALDIKHHCATIPPGRGRQMSCLLEALQDRRVRLQPQCKKWLQDRLDMWSYAKLIEKPQAPPRRPLLPTLLELFFRVFF